MKAVYVGSHELQPRLCPHCGAVLEAAMSASDQPIQVTPGAWTMCAYCGGMGVFTDSLGTTRKPSDVEQAEFEAWLALPEQVVTRVIMKAGRAIGRMRKRDQPFNPTKIC